MGDFENAFWFFFVAKKHTKEHPDKKEDQMSQKGQQHRDDNVGDRTAHQQVVLPFFPNTLSMMPPTTSTVFATLSLNDILALPQQQPDAQKFWDTVVLSNYMIDFEWMLQSIPALSKHANRIVVIHGDGDGAHIRRAVLKYQLANSCAVSIHKAHLPISYGTHHTKCILAFKNDGDDETESGGLRVAICTANFIYDDWNNKNQGVYCQDFPRKKQQPRIGDVDPISFGKDLLAYFKVAVGSSGCWDASKLLEYDYTLACGHVVASVPGYHVGPAMNEWGFLKLREILSKATTAACAPAAGEKVGLTWQFSSQGSLTDKFLQDFTHAQTSNLAAAGRSAGANVRVVFPTEEEVRCSVEGWRAGSSIPLFVKNCNPYLNSRYHRWGERFEADMNKVLQHHPRQRAMPHIKTYAQYFIPAHINTSEEHSRVTQLNWFCVTSSNLSRAAWGDLQRQNSQLGIRSFELGVVFTADSVRRYVDAVASSSGAKGLFSCTPERPIQQQAAIAEAPELLGKQRKEDGVYPFELATPGAIKPLLLIPYNIANPTPYDSTATGNFAQGGTRLSRDIPWVLDPPTGHHGSDAFKKTFKNVFVDGGGANHYGVACWTQPVVDFSRCRVLGADTPPTAERNPNKKKMPRPERDVSIVVVDSGSETESVQEVDGKAGSSKKRRK